MYDDGNNSINEEKRQLNINAGELCTLSPRMAKAAMFWRMGDPVLLDQTQICRDLGFRTGKRTAKHQDTAN